MARITQAGLVKSVSPVSRNAARVASGSVRSAGTLMMRSLPPVASARRWLITTGSLSTYSTAARALWRRTISCTAGAVGSPAPRSVYSATPWTRT